MGTMDGRTKVFVGVISTVALGFTTGCSDPSADSSEAISTIEAAFSQSTCATAAADQTFSGGIDPAIVSPRTYNTCYKGYVVDIENLDAAYTGPGELFDGGIWVSYADTTITDQATCEATRLRAIFYRYYDPSNTSTNGIGSDWVVLDDEGASYGRWALGGNCVLEQSFTEVVPGLSYRVAATARTSSDATRKVRIGTYGPVDSP
jgi:hypothetical protein